MLEFGALAILGIAVGALGTFVGVGGGFLLVPSLLLLYPDDDPDTITAISLLVILANAASGSVEYARQRRIDVRSGLWFALATLPGALAGVLIVGELPRRAFDAIFTAVMAAVGAYLLLPRPAATIRDPLTGRGIVRRMIRDRDGDTFAYAYRLWHGLALSLSVGFVASLLGIGGGLFHVPAMAILLRFPVHIATATSQFVLGLTAAQATLAHIAAGSLASDGALARAVPIAVGAIAGAQLGARAAHRARGPLIIRVLGVALLLVAARLALLAAGV